MNGSTLLRMTGCGIAVFTCLFGAAAAPASAAPKHPALHAALFELREARTELKEAAHDFGGHREAAIKDIDISIVQIEKALAAQDDLNFKGERVKDLERYKGYAHHPHIHHAIHELRVARGELKEARHDFGGHREAAIKAIDASLVQLELAIKFANKK